METFILTIQSGLLQTGDLVYLYSYGATDISGNVQIGEYYYYAYVVAGASAPAPTVIEVNPEASLTGVPTNTQPQIEFSEEISGASTQSGIQLLHGGTPVPATVTLSRGNTVATIVPNDPLTESTAYTISASGVQNIEGTPMASAYTSTFTTSATGISLTQPTVVSVTPANGTINVPTSVTPTVVFTEAMDPLIFDEVLSCAYIATSPSSGAIPATVSFSPDGKTATFTPTSPLASGTTYYLNVGYYYCDVTDVAGNDYVSGLATLFTTQ
jgi:hypothetical protein